MMATRPVWLLKASLLSALALALLFVVFEARYGADTVHSAGTVEMSLGSTKLGCSPQPKPDYCDIPFGGSFAVTVTVDSLAGLVDEDGDTKSGYLTYKALLNWTAGLNVSSVVDLWPDCVLLGGPVIVSGEAAVACTIGIGANESTYIGALASFDFTCNGAALATITMVAGTGFDTKLVDEAHADRLPKEDTLTINCGSVGGIAELPESDKALLEVPDSSRSNAGLIGGIVAGVAAGAVALGGASWYTRRRWARRDD